MRTELTPPGIPQARSVVGPVFDAFRHGALVCRREAFRRLSPAAFLLIVVVFGLVGCRSNAVGLSACQALERDDLEAVVGRSVGLATEFTLEGDRPSTGCRFGTLPVPTATVFVVRSDAAAVFDGVRAAGPRLGAIRDLDGAGYQAFVIGTPPASRPVPGDVSETLLLLRHGILVRVNLQFVPAGSADRLAAPIAARIR